MRIPDVVRYAGRVHQQGPRVLRRISRLVAIFCASRFSLRPRAFPAPPSRRSMRLFLSGCPPSGEAGNTPSCSTRMAARTENGDSHRIGGIPHCRREQRCIPFLNLVPRDESRKLHPSVRSRKATAKGHPEFVEGNLGVRSVLLPLHSSLPGARIWGSLAWFPCASADDCIIYPYIRKHNINY